MSRRFLIAALVAVVVIVAGAGALYQWLVPGLSSARTEAGPLETSIATWLLHRSVPDKRKRAQIRWGMTRPKSPPARDLFGQKCEVCTWL